MDSYQRGYSPGISGITGNKIGTASILEVELPESSQSDGFYAAAYQWGADKVISYRGTDFDVTNSFQRGDSVTVKLDKAIKSEFLKDLVNGWSTFLAGGQTLRRNSITPEPSSPRFREVATLRSMATDRFTTI